jgi:L-arabinose isomerase
MDMTDLKKLEAWLVAGSQELYGREILEKVGAHSREMAQWLSHSATIPLSIVSKPVVTSPEGIRRVCLEAEAAPNCVGLILWMHTFSPAKMWIAGLASLRKPFLHLHTQYNREIPWSAIDMDFMNLNQSAHGDREFGFLASRLRLERKVIAGYWQDEDLLESLGVWLRAAAAWQDAQGMKVARFGDNMRDVAVTEGDKVEAQIRFGYSVDGFGIGDLAERVQAASETEIERLLEQYEAGYQLAKPLRKDGEKRENLREAARIEAGLRAFLSEGGFKAFTTCFQQLHGMNQLPGLAVQRLMAEGYGFGAEGDWKTAALVRSLKVMGAGLPGGSSFMEDYTYHLVPGGMKVLGAHMLEVCTSIAEGKPSLEVHPLFAGGKEDPARLVFDARQGPALNVTVVDLGDRFRMVANQVDTVPPERPLPKLPVARALWLPRPDLKTASAAWILAGGAHHFCYTQALGPQHLEDFAGMAGIEFLLIDGKTDLATWRKELRWNDLYYHLARGL